MLQKDDMRVLKYKRSRFDAPNDQYKEIMVNIVVGDQDMTLGLYEFHKLVKLVNLTVEAEKA